MGGCCHIPKDNIITNNKQKCKQYQNSKSKNKTVETRPNQSTEYTIQTDYPINTKYQKNQKTKNKIKQINSSSKTNQQLINYIMKLCETQSQKSQKNNNQKVNKENQIVKQQVVKFLQILRLTQVEFHNNSQFICQIIKHYYQDVNISKLNKYTFPTNAEFQNSLKQIEFYYTNPFQHFRMKGKLGKGGSCEVFLVEERHNTNKVYAVRTLKIQNDVILSRIKREILVMQKCASKYVIKYYRSYYYQQTLFMFVQYMQKGSLIDFICQQQQPIEEEMIAFILRQVLCGLKLLHQKKQIHRDIKSDNILISKNGDIKLADFGLAIQLTKEVTNRSSAVGTPAWMAPQLIQKKKYNQLVDIWSLGILSFELSKGQPPNLYQSPLRILYLTLHSQPPQLQNVSIELQDFVRRCLQKNPIHRDNVDQLLNHNFIKKLSNGNQQRQKFIKMINKQ